MFLQQLTQGNMSPQASNNASSLGMQCSDGMIRLKRTSLDWADAEFSRVVLPCELNMVLVSKALNAAVAYAMKFTS